MTSVDCDDCALIAGDEHDLGMIRVDPDAVIIIPAGGAFERVPRHPAIGRFPNDHIRGINDILILRIGLDFGKIISPAPEALVTVELLPAFAGIVTSVNAAIGSIGSHGSV